MIPLNINFLKSQQTVGELRILTREAQSPIKSQSVISWGEKLVARTGNKIPARKNDTRFNPHCSSITSFSLTPQAFNYTKLNNARRNLQVQKDLKDLGIEML
jgi:hypothetical protein